LPIAAGATNANPTLRTIVIGRYPHYLELGNRLKAKVFNIPQAEWDAMAPDEKWAINREFLDAAIAAGEQIILETAPEKVPIGSTLEKGIGLSRQPWVPS
jgi:hypothetical protein